MDWMSVFDDLIECVEDSDGIVFVFHDGALPEGTYFATDSLAVKGLKLREEDDGHYVVSRGYELIAEGYLQGMFIAPKHWPPQTVSDKE